MEIVEDFFGSIGESIGRDIGLSLLGIFILFVVAQGGFYLSKFLIWAMHALKVKNFAISDFLESHSYGLIFYLLMLALLVMIFVI